MLSDESMITAGHSIESLGIIAKHKPKRRNEITNQLLKVKTIKRNSECRNILLGKCFKAIDAYIDKSETNDEIIKFVNKELKNGRPATARKAAAFLKKHE
jgi:hypothetical protein